MTERTTTASNTPAPASHVAVALHATTQHLIDNDLPIPFEIRVSRGDRIDVVLYEPVYEMWLATVHGLDGQPPVEHTEQPLPSGSHRVWSDAVLPDQGVRVRLISSRQVVASPGRRRLTAVAQ